MVVQRTGNRTPRCQGTRQRSLFGPSLPSVAEVNGPDVPCDVVAIEKRRDGGTRYWCRAHRADATAKAGKPARKCRAADTSPIRAEEILTLDLDKYLGGVALWGAVPAVYDTTRLLMDRGIHVHARLTPESKKEMDETRRAVRLVGRGLPAEGVVVNETDAIYYMVSSAFDFPMQYVTCTHCGWAPRQGLVQRPPAPPASVRRLWEHFRDRVTARDSGSTARSWVCARPQRAEHKIEAGREDSGHQAVTVPRRHSGLGSNPAFLWTQPSTRKGIHVHAFLEGETEPGLDDTFARSPSKAFA